VVGTSPCGPRGFAAPVSDSRVLIGERSEVGTTLTLVDTERACLVWQRDLDRLAFDASVAAEPGKLELAVHDPKTRGFEGLLVLDAEYGTTEALIDGQCSSDCYPNDGQLDPAAFGPTVAARPVPAFAAGGWPRDTSLGFRWQSGEAPPTWARPDIKAAAADASASSGARSPRFVYSDSAADSIRYTSLFPTFCRYGIACASRNMPSFWAVWLRPHGTDFSWGTLRWCQMTDTSGCFDIRRVMLHELGHITGLNHPSSEGFRLEAQETIMHAIAPAKPSAGSSRHTFGRCDVATLQELYDVPTNSTAISSCNDVATQLALSASATSVSRGGSVKLTARLMVVDSSSFGLLAGNLLNGRSVKLKYRRAGSTDAWSSVWMTPRPTGGGYYDSTITPSATWEFEAAFPSPSGEGLRYSASNIVKVKVTK
jgi:hypothetical protein